MHTALIVLGVILALKNVVAQDSMRQLYELHNSERAVHRVPPLQWDEKLQAVATTYARSCPSGAGGTRHSDAEWRRSQYISVAGREPPGGSVGENLAYGPAFGVDDALSFGKLWFDEKRGWDCPSDNCYESICGHYRQAVWQETTHMGCAINACSSNDVLLVCMYAKFGNMIPERPFPASQCNSGGGGLPPVSQPPPTQPPPRNFPPSGQPVGNGWQPVGQPVGNGWQPVGQPVGNGWQPVGQPVDNRGWGQPVGQPVGNGWQPVGQPMDNSGWGQPVGNGWQPVGQPMDNSGWQPVGQPIGNGWQPVGQPMDNSGGWQPVGQPMDNSGGWQPMDNSGGWQPVGGGWRSVGENPSNLPDVQHSPSVIAGIAIGLTVLGVMVVVLVGLTIALMRSERRS